MVVAYVRCRRYYADPVILRHARHCDARVELRSAVVQTRHDVAVQIDHATDRIANLAACSRGGSTLDRILTLRTSVLLLASAASLAACTGCGSTPVRHATASCPLQLVPAYGNT